MSPESKEPLDLMRTIVHELLAGRASDIFLGKIDAIIDDWGGGKLTASQACEKVQKSVSLFIDEDLAKEIGNKCALVVMRESSPRK